MRKFTIRLPMPSEQREFDENTRRGFWIYELNAEWNMKCICEQSKSRNPSFLEIRRKSAVGEKLISGSLELYDNKEKMCLLKRKFISLIEDGRHFVKIELQSSHNAVKPSLELFLTGDINISTGTDSSLNLTELVHLTTTNCSSLKKLSNDMESLLLKKSFLPDVSLKCGSVSILAHKCILSVRSPVFKAMFSCPMTEAMENEVIIEGIKVPVLQIMIKYIYTGKSEDLTPEFVSDLLFAANRYQIASLESACIKYLMKCMSMKNIAGLLLHGDIVSANVKQFAIDFLCRNCTDYAALEKTEDWISLKNSKPALVLEIFSAVVKYQELKLKM